VRYSILSSSGMLGMHQVIPSHQADDNSILLLANPVYDPMIFEL
jgi:hypothetical protein